jgi:hypothetical protein
LKTMRLALWCEKREKLVSFKGAVKDAGAQQH